MCANLFVNIIGKKERNLNRKIYQMLSWWKSSSSKSYRNSWSVYFVRCELLQNNSQGTESTDQEFHRKHIYSHSHKYSHSLLQIILVNCCREYTRMQHINKYNIALAFAFMGAEIKIASICMVRFIIWFLLSIEIFFKSGYG